MIILYKGARGKGKTLTMVKDAYQYLRNGWRLLANFELSIAEPIDNEEIISLDKTSPIKNAVLCIDELQIFFDSRRAMQKKNMDFSNFIQQIRKRNITLLVTSQFSNTVDLRLRQHLDIIAYPKFYKPLDVCEVTYMDLTTVEDDMIELGKVREPKSIKVVYDAKPFYNLYKTEEMIV